MKHVARYRRPGARCFFLCVCAVCYSFSLSLSLAVGKGRVCVFDAALRYGGCALLCRGWHEMHPVTRNDCNINTASSFWRLQHGYLEQLNNRWANRIASVALLMYYRCCWAALGLDDLLATSLKTLRRVWRTGCSLFFFLGSWRRRLDQMRAPSAFIFGAIVPWVLPSVLLCSRGT